ncbi:hypothetical protein D3C80_1998740 [compost metagenome]
MKHLTLLVEALFEDYCHKDAPDFKLDREFVDFLIENNDFLVYLSALASPSSRHHYDSK